MNRTAARIENRLHEAFTDTPEVHISVHPAGDDITVRAEMEGETYSKQHPTKDIKFPHLLQYAIAPLDHWVDTIAQAKGATK
ncbi:hypothetical protein SEA_OTTAWA_90 [Arthrobacter phage Ottawa]|nr:hypothetical protein SEA_KHARCHO_90 [Arthrobacter phage Kharcho]WIC89322.1 hypothetical protein SEA_OTTAWA_90 [Arthrobacter phage Ottawa]